MSVAPCSLHATSTSEHITDQVMIDEQTSTHAEPTSFFVDVFRDQEAKDAPYWQVCDISFFAIQSLAEAQEEELYQYLQIFFARQCMSLFGESFSMPDGILGLVVAYAQVSTPKVESAIEAFSRSFRDPYCESQPILVYIEENESTWNAYCFHTMTDRIIGFLSEVKPFCLFSFCESEIEELNAENWERERFLKLLEEKSAYGGSLSYSLFSQKLRVQNVALCKFSKEEFYMHFSKVINSLFLASDGIFEKFQGVIT
jgi:hypothetical protein